MKSFISPLLLACLISISASAQEPTSNTAANSSTFTFGGGGAWLVGLGASTGPQLNTTYEYRLQKYFGLELGVDSTIVNTPTLFTSFILVPGSGLSTVTPIPIDTLAKGHVTTIPFGVRGFLPLRQGRAELFLGVGGAHLWNPSSVNRSATNYWGPQGNLGFRIALDPQNRLWLGSTLRAVYTFHNEIVPTWTADLGLRLSRK